MTASAKSAVYRAYYSRTSVDPCGILNSIRCNLLHSVHQKWAHSVKGSVSQTIGRLQSLQKHRMVSCLSLPYIRCWYQYIIGLLLMSLFVEVLPLAACACRFDMTTSCRTTWSHKDCAVWRQRRRRSRSRGLWVHCQPHSRDGTRTLPQRRCNLLQRTHHRQWRNISSWLRHLWDCQLLGWVEVFQWLSACLLEWWACYRISHRLELGIF